MATEASFFLPDTQAAQTLSPGHTWVDSAPGVRGEELRARWLQQDAGALAGWIRQRPLFHGIQTLSQSIPPSTWTAVTGLSELIDNYAGHSDATNTGRYSPPYTLQNHDWYLAKGLVPFNTSSTSDGHIAGLRVNGSTIYEGVKLPSGAGHVLTTSIVDLIQLDSSPASSDYIELAAWHNEAGAVSTVVSGKTPSLQVRWVCMDPTSSDAFTPALPGVPHVWTDTDIWTGSATGANKVPLNTELRDVVRFLHNPPIFRVHASGTSQTIPSGAGTWTAFTYTGESVDNYGMWSSGATVTCQRAGLYYVAGLGPVSEALSKVGYRAIRIHHGIAAGGSADYYGISAVPMTGSKQTGTTLLADATIRMAVNDTLQLQFDHTQGAALSVIGTSATNSARMIGVWMAR